MSYINLPGGIPGFSKAVISLWFRVPAASIAAAADAANKDNFDFRAPLTAGGVIPLATFGNSFSDAYAVSTDIVNAGTYTSNEWSVDGTTCEQTLVGSSQISYTEVKQSEGPTYTLDPCHIGIDCSYDPPVLRIYLQTGNYATMDLVSGETSVTIGTADYLDQSGLAGTSCPNVVSLPSVHGGTTFVLTDTVWETRQETFDAAELHAHGSREAFGGSSNITVTPDVWHHLLVSFDVSGDVSATGGASPAISSSCKMYVSFDDKNYNGSDLPMAAFPGFLGPNDIYTQKALDTTGDSGMGPSADNTIVDAGIVAHIVSISPGGPPAYSLTGASISAGSMGLPAIATLVQSVRHVEMAEFQMWTGKTLDTSVATNRRAFVDAQGKPVDPNKQIGPIALLGRKPDVLLHGSGNWVHGKNTGSSTQQFKPTGVIKPYKPEPKLGA